MKGSESVHLEGPDWILLYHTHRYNRGEMENQVRTNRADPSIQGLRLRNISKKNRVGYAPGFQSSDQQAAQHPFVSRYRDPQVSE